MRPIVAETSQVVLAARVETTRSRVNQFVNKFRKLGLIEYNGDIKVHAGLLDVIVHDLGFPSRTFMTVLVVL